MNTDDFKKHGITVGVAAAAALAVGLATRPHVFDAPLTVQGSQSRIDLAPRASESAPDPCKAKDGVYADEMAIPSEGCKLRVIHERPLALAGCGSDRTGVYVHTIPGERLVVPCEMAK